MAQLAHYRLSVGLFCLKKEGLIKRVGPDKGGHWEVSGLRRMKIARFEDIEAWQEAMGRPETRDRRPETTDRRP